MLVDDQFRKCAVFVTAGVRRDDHVELVPAATAFLVGMPRPGGLAEAYAVTARHVVDSARPHEGMFLRFNLLSGGWQDHPSQPDEWLAHSSNDVAVLRVRPPDGADMRLLPLDRLATRDYVTANRVGEGDELFIVGLFAPRPGQERAQPIVRFGTIALMPREPVAVRTDPGSETTTRLEAYLVEARSWGGVSGSPAFVYYSPAREEGFIELGTYGTSRIMLLGLIQGHFQVEQEVTFLGDVGGSAKVAQNAGLAAVVPSWAIRELLEEADGAR